MGKAGRMLLGQWPRAGSARSSRMSQGKGEVCGFPFAGKNLGGWKTNIMVKLAHFLRSSVSLLYIHFSNNWLITHGIFS